MKKVIFYYDTICPYAYIASTRIENICKKNNALVEFKPVLLGGIYKETEAPQGKI